MYVYYILCMCVFTNLSSKVLADSKRLNRRVVCRRFLAATKRYSAIFFFALLHPEIRFEKTVRMHDRLCLSLPRESVYVVFHATVLVQKLFGRNIFNLYEQA